MSWVANASYDGVIRLTKIVLDKALSQTCETTERLFYVISVNLKMQRTPITSSDEDDGLCRHYGL